MDSSSIFDYKVYSPGGALVMQTVFQKCRYPPNIELELLKSGYRIVVDGKRLSKRIVETHGGNRNG